MILHVGLCGARARADQGHRLGLGGGGPRHSRGGDAGGGDGERRRARSESVDAQNGVPFRKSAHCRSTLRAWYINCTKSVVLIVLVGKEPGTRVWLGPHGVRRRSGADTVRLRLPRGGYGYGVC